MKRLARAGLNITDMLCEFTVKTVKGKSGIFPVVITKVMESPKPVNALDAKKDIAGQVLGEDIKDDQIPF